MIKIFGKYRYHWQPELSLSVIYWCFTFMLLFIPLAIFFEISYVNSTIRLLISAFILLTLVGFHRYFVLTDDELHITKATLFNTEKIPLASIKKVEVRCADVTIYSVAYPTGKTYRMRKWPKHYFINALAVNPGFQGEVELCDHLQTVDYFELYYAKEPSKRVARG